MTHIRRAEFEDIEAIADIYNEAILTTTATFDLEPKTLDDRREWFSSHGARHPILVAELDGMVVGWASLNVWNPRAAYDDTAETSFYVKEEYRGRGIGRRLKQAIMDEARKAGFHTLIAGAAEGSDASLHLNREFGFEVVGTFREVGHKFGKNLDVTYLQKFLNRGDVGVSARPAATELSYYLLDVFTDTRFGGNPLAVFPNADVLTDQQMQTIAGELNLSETTFIQSPRSQTSDCTVRIFTPKNELLMAGHPTIGTAWVILKNGFLKQRNEDHLVFDEGVGSVRVDFAMEDCGRPADLVMHQPLPEFGEVLDKTCIAQLLSLQESDIDDDFPVQVVSCGVPIILIPLKSLDAVRRARVRLDLIDSPCGDTECRELFVFTRETEQQDANVHCRFFAPRFGVPEDPATGGAHGPLGSYLVKYGLSDGRQIISEQGIEMGRPSRITVRVESNGAEITGVRVGGECVEVGAGTIRLDSNENRAK